MLHPHTHPDISSDLKWLKIELIVVLNLMLIKFRSF